MTNPSPLVTVYITNYNYGEYIERAIQSVLRQSFQDFELLIIDDGSTDNSREIIEEYSNRDEVEVIYQKNKGLNISNNIALRTANGKYIMRLDADDFLEPDALRKLVETLENDGELGLVYPDYYLVDNDGCKTGEIRQMKLQDVSLFDQPAHGACTMIRKEFLNKIGGYDENYQCQDGYELWIKFINRHEVANINEPLFNYRQHDENLTSNEKKLLNTRANIRKDFVHENKLDLPETVAIIPIRETIIRDQNLPFVRINDETLLEKIIKKARNAENVDRVIVTSSLDEVEQFTEDISKDWKDVNFITRPTSLERVNVDLGKTYKHVIKHEKNVVTEPEALLSLTLEYPFISPGTIDDAIHTLSIFEADSLLSVRPDNMTYYQHNGAGMEPILDQEKFTKYEREAIYKGAGGLKLTYLDPFLEQNDILPGKVGHVIVSNKEAFGIFHKFDLEIIKNVNIDEEIRSITR